jgi:hypothetical protein
MKAICLLTLLLMVTVLTEAQTATKVSYLVIKIEQRYDTDNTYYVIAAEAGNAAAKDIYRLVTYRPGKYSLNQPAFYQVRTDTSTVFYNCFANTTEALSFLAERNWELVTVGSEISSGYSTYYSYPYTTISSTPVYYFKKNMQQ